MGFDGKNDGGRIQGLSEERTPEQKKIDTEIFLDDLTELGDI